MSEQSEQLKEKLIDKMQGVELCIRHILALHPEARDNDKLLMLLYWELVDKINIPKEFRQDFLYKATHPETIRRARQKIQSAGDYLPSPEVLEARRRKQQAMRQALSPKQKTLV
jgi:hypothetical protein